MKLALKLSLAMGFLTILMCITGIFSLYQMSDVNRASTDITESWLPSVVHAQRLNTLSSNYRIQEIMHIYSTNSEDMREYEQKMQEYLTEFNKYVAGYRTLVSSPEEKRNYENFLGQWKVYTAAHDEIYGLSKQNKTQEAVAILSTRSRDAFNAASDALEKAVTINRDGADQASLYGDNAYANARMWIIGVLIMSMLLAAGLTLFIVRGILKQLGKDPGDLARIARRVVDGDYTIDDGSPKIGVYGNIVEMVAALKSISTPLSANRNGPPESPSTPGKPWRKRKPRAPRRRPRRTACSAPPTSWKKWRTSCLPPPTSFPRRSSSPSAGPRNRPPA